MENPDTPMAGAEENQEPNPLQRPGPAWVTDEEALQLPRVTKQEIEDMCCGNAWGSDLRPLPANISTVEGNYRCAN